MTDGTTLAMIHRASRRSGMRHAGLGCALLVAATTVLVAQGSLIAQSGPAAGTASAAQPQTAAPASVAPLPGVDTVLDARAKAIASRLRCPVCQGESIQDSPAELAAQMKSLVREQLASGRSNDEVFAYFVQKYGQWILLEPQASGFNLLVYWLPVAFLVLGGAGIAVAVRKWTRPVVPAATDAVPVAMPSEASPVD